jgi:hypothetical protein
MECGCEFSNWSTSALIPSLSVHQSTIAHNRHDATPHDETSLPFSRALQYYRRTLAKLKL